MAKKYVNASKNAGLKTNRITKRPVTTFVNASKRDEDKNQGGILGGTGYLLGNLGLGLAGVGEGVSDILSAGGDLLRGDTEMAKYRFKDNQTAEAREKLEKSYNPGTVMKLAGDVSSGIGNSLTFMIPYVGPYLAGAGYVGMGISDAAAKTGDVGAKELAYGAVSGALEFGLDALTGGAGKAAKNLGASITRKLGREAAQAGAKATGKLAGKSFGKSVLVESLKGAGGEALEESLSELIDPQLQKLFGIDKNAETSLKNVAYAGLIGAISGGLMTAGPAAINYKNAASVGKQIRESGETEDFIQYTNDVLKAAQRTQTKYATAAEEAKAPADASVVQKFNAALNPLSAKNKSNRAKKRVEAIADTVQKNLNTLQQYRQNPTKTPKELEIADAVLGELRGNVFLLENASLLEYYEDAILDLSDEDKQSFVDEVNRRAKNSNAKKSDYTVEDLNNNTDDILTSVAAWRIDEDQYGDLFAKARKATQNTETTSQPAQKAAQATEGVKDEEAPTQPTNAVKKRFVGNGEVRIAGGKQVKDLNLSDEQYTAYKAAEILAPTTGADIELHETLDKDGKTANGYYDPATNTIHININAKRGSTGKQIALYTLGHETTHYIREWSPAKYDELASFVMDKLGADTESLVSSKADFLRTISDYQNKTDEEIMELAREEVVADGMELILTDGKVLDELARTDRTLWQKVKSWIENIISKIRKAYADLNQASKTAQTLKETMDSLEEVERLFTEGVKAAGEQTRTERKETADRKYSVDEESYEEKKSLEDYDYDLTDPWSIEPINNVTDRKKFNYLVKEFEETGYNGRPIVIVGNVAITGSHRIMAAREAGIDIPTIDAEVDENNPLFFDLIDAKDDEDRLEISKQLFEDGNMSEEAYKLIEREDDLNYENWKKKPEDQIRYSIDDSNLSDEDKAILFDNDFYERYENESREPITETVEELEKIKNSETFSSMTDDEAFDLNAKLKAKRAGFETVYEYYVETEKERMAEEYRRYVTTGRSNRTSRTLEEKRKRAQKERSLRSEMATETPLKNEQYKIIQETNPMWDEYHTGIRSPKDIKTFAEVAEDADSFTWGDFTREDAQKALREGKVRVYSSYAIKNGVFVSTSYQQALNYAGNDPTHVHSRVVALESVAWINGDEGQYAKVYKKGDIRYSIDDTPADSADDTNVGSTEGEKAKTNPWEAAIQRMQDRDRTAEEHIRLAEHLMGEVQNEREYQIVKNYKAKAEEMADTEARLGELRKKTAAVNKEIKTLKKTKADMTQDRAAAELEEATAWIDNEINEAMTKKQGYMTEMDEIEERLEKDVQALMSLDFARPLREIVRNSQKRADAMERAAEKADERVAETKEWAKKTVRDIRAESNEKIRQAREDATDYKSAVYAKAYEKADERVRKHEQKREEKAKQSAERKEITIRKRATMRILGQINTMLYHPTKTKHVPADLQELAQTILRSVNPKDFEKNRNNLREMGELAAKIEQDERKVAKTAKEQETMEKRKSKYEHLEAETLSTKRQAEVLLKAFEDYQKQASEGSTFDQALIDSMSDAVDKIEEVPMTEMGLKSLEAVERFCTLLKHQIDNANKTFATEKSLDIDELGRKAATETRETKPLKVLSPKGMEIAAFERVRKYFWKNMKPLTVFEAIGSKTFADLFQNVLNGEDVWARDIVEAKEKIQDVREKYKYKDWDLDERRAVKTKDGTVNLSLSEIMSLYAYSFRKQAISHLEGGGFILDANATTKAKGEKLSMVALERRLNDSKRYVLDELLIGELAGMLTADQQEYVKEMQKYLTSLGEKGNTVSRKLYGIDIFTESDYFPIKVKSEYLKSQTGKSGDPNIKNRGMTKEVVPEAKDPLVLQGFDEIMVDHINSMATYHAFVLPIEDLTRVLNYKPMNVKRDKDGNPILDENGMPVADDKSGADYSTLKAVIESKYGATANEYIVQLIRDLNGGARRDAAAGIIDQGITAFKRASTMASLSVLVQQPTSLFRAVAYIDAKYLFGNASIVDFSHHKELWKRVKKYAPVAIIKEMGGYDTGVGARTGDYLNAATYEKGERVKGFLTDSNYRSEVFGIGAAYADEMAWIQLCEACVSEQADKLRADRNSEKVLQAAGKRFEEVVRRTQVYDSTLTRSEYMRSKDTGAKMATAFMAEPTTIVSMVTDALIKAERGDAKFLRNTAAAVAMSVIVNALAASLVYAMRDDDKDETYKEKYIASVAMETADAFNPLGYLPIARDIVSIMQGYEVERSDMTLVSNLVDQVEMITSSKRSVADKVAGVSGAVSAFFGIPVTNVYRDAKGALNTILGQVDTEKTTNAGISAAIKKEFTTIFGLFDEKTKNSYQLYQATIKGDETHLNRVRARYESPQAAELALRQALRDNDPRIAEAAQARISGELDVYESIVEQIEGEGVFDRNIVIRAVNNEINAINNDAKATTVPKAEDEEEDTPEQLYKSSDLNAALERGDEDDFLDVYASLLSYKMDAGKTEAQAKSAVKSSITTYWKKRYLAAWEANDTQEIKRIQAVLLSTGLYGSQNEVAETGRNWIRAYAESTSK